CSGNFNGTRRKIWCDSLLRVVEKPAPVRAWAARYAYLHHKHAISNLLHRLRRARAAYASRRHYPPRMSRRTLLHVGSPMAVRGLFIISASDSTLLGNKN